MMRDSAGTLLYRRDRGVVRVLIIEPGGFARRYGWSIPKGMVEAGESIEAAARRETREETGLTPGALTPLGFIEYRKSKKRIHCFAGPAPAGTIQPQAWEVARAEFVTLDEAAKLLHPDQAAFIERLRAILP